MRLTTIFMILPLLTACGAAIPTNPVTYTSLTVFSDGGGVMRGLGTDTGATLIAITPNVASVVTSGNNSAASDTPSAIDPASFALVSSNARGDIRSGTLTVGSTVVNVDVYTDIAETAGLLKLTVPSDGNQIMAIGNQVDGMPTGTFSYVGQHIFGVRSAGGTTEVGAFDLNANFDSSTFTYSGLTDNTTLSGSGVIDSSNGRIASNSLSLTTPSGGYTVTMHGQFHGTNATGVSGIYHTNDTNPDFSGGFVGSR